MTYIKEMFVGYVLFRRALLYSALVMLLLFKQSDCCGVEVNLDIAITTECMNAEICVQHTT